MPKQSHARVTLQLRGQRLVLAAVADTHSRPHPRAAEHLAALRPDAILHAGDVGDLAVLTKLREIAPVIAVRGNIDGREPSLPDTTSVLLEDGDGVFFRILLLHIAVYGPKLRAEAGRLARAEGADLVVCGHSHVPFLSRDRGLVVFNPGSIGPRRFQLPIVLGVIEVSRARVDVRHVDCETGERWAPPRTTEALT